MLPKEITPGVGYDANLSLCQGALAFCLYAAVMPPEHATALVGFIKHHEHSITVTHDACDQLL